MLEGSLDDLRLRRGTYIEQDGDGMSAADGVLRPLQVALEVHWIELFDQIHALQYTQQKFSEWWAERELVDLYRNETSSIAHCNFVDSISPI